MSRPRLLDLFCGAGGCSVGYARAGFEVVGVDIKQQPRYPFAFKKADAMTFPLDGFDAIHASPPCHDHSPLKSRAGADGTGWMLGATLERLAAQPAVWVVENVGAAHNRADILLCGEMFGLRTVRHRRFTIDPRFPGLLAVPPHRRHQRPTSTKNRVAALSEGHNLSITGDVGVHAGPQCMGIDWMSGDELSQAIPPAYCQFIGEMLLLSWLRGDGHLPPDSSLSRRFDIDASPDHKTDSRPSMYDPAGSSSFERSRRSGSAEIAECSIGSSTDRGVQD